jgi:hypothetical protein
LPAWGWAAALVAFMSRATDPRYTATQYALFSSLAAVPRTFINSSVGYIVAKPDGSGSLSYALSLHFLQ